MKIPKYIYEKMIKLNNCQRKASMLSYEVRSWLEKNGIPEDWENDIFIDTLDYGHGSVDGMLELLGWTRKQTR